MEVSDDGKGFDSSTVDTMSSFGLTNMKARACALGGKFEVFSNPENGTTIQVEAPI